MAAKITSASPGESRNEDVLSLQVSLPQMLDLALGTPEVGTVNLNILHNFLHVLLQQSNLESTKVEYRGDEAARIKTMISSSEARPNFEFHKYNIVDASDSLVHRDQEMESEIYADVYTDTGKSREGPDTDVTEERDASTVKKTNGLKQKISNGTNGERQSVIFVEPVLNGATPTALGFKRLEDSVKALEQKFQVLDQFVDNNEMIERVRSSKGDALSDMWHTINVSGRLDASEQAMEKLTTMVQDLIKHDKIKDTGGEEPLEELTNFGERMDQLENQVAYLNEHIYKIENLQYDRDEEVLQMGGRETPLKKDDGLSKIASVNESEGEGRADLGRESSAPKNDQDVSSRQEMRSHKGQHKTPSVTTRRSIISGIDLTELQSDVSTMKEEITKIQKDMHDLSLKIISSITHSDTVPTGIDSPRSAKKEPSKSASAATPIAAHSTDAISTDNTDDESNVASRKATIKSDAAGRSQSDKKISSSTSSHVELVECPDKNGSVRSAGSEMLSSAAIKELDSRITDVEKKMIDIIQRINKEFTLEGGSVINGLAQKIQATQAEIIKLNEVTSQFVEEREDKDTHMSALVEQIELLKTIKADREDLEDALADKADAQVVNRKVSHDQFDAACDDLARGLESAISKLSQQESTWQQSLDEIQREIESKLDKMEISPLKEFVNNRLKTLQEKLKAVVEARRDNEAAGTKKMLSDVQCISCDANAVMRMEEGVQYRAPALPSSRSVKPYLTFELDQVRKQQKKIPYSRNMLQYEAAMQEMTRKTKPLKEDPLIAAPTDHLCNRYCGGSHTITTPQQRVMRMGHFLTQWGPEAIQLSEGDVVGTDGQLYRGRALADGTSVRATCGNGSSTDVHPPNQQVKSKSPSPNLSQTNQKRSSSIRMSKTTNGRKLSERIKESADSASEEIPVERRSNTSPSVNVSAELVVSDP